MIEESPDISVFDIGMVTKGYLATVGCRAYMYVFDIGMVILK